MIILFGGKIFQNFSKSDQKNFQNEFHETLFLHTFAKYEYQFFHFMVPTGLNLGGINLKFSQILGQIVVYNF
jgi:hypothetical protein